MLECLAVIIGGPKSYRNLLKPQFSDVVSITIGYMQITLDQVWDYCDESSLLFFIILTGWKMVGWCGELCSWRIWTNSRIKRQGCWSRVNSSFSSLLSLIINYSYFFSLFVKYPILEFRHAFQQSWKDLNKLLQWNNQEIFIGFFFKKN